jgi:hypothetical protein
VTCGKLHTHACEGEEDGTKGMKVTKNLVQHKNKKVINKNIATFGKEKIPVSQE